MHARSFVSGTLAALIAAVGAWAAIHAAQRHAELQRSADLAQHEAVATGQRIVALRAQLARLPPRRPAAPPSPVPLAYRPKASPASVPIADVSAVRREAQRKRLDQAHALFFTRIGLTPEQIDRFNTLAREHEAWERDYLTGLREQQVSPRSAGAVAMRKQEDERFDAALHDLLGSDNAQKLKDYDAAAPYRESVDTVVANLALTDSPLTPSQAKQLQELLQSAKVTTQTDRADGWNSVLAQAATFLQPPQMEELRAEAMAAQQWSLMRELETLIARSPPSAK